MILGIDTSLGTAVAVTDPDGAVLAEQVSDNPLGHAEVIGTLVQSALAGAALGPVGATSAPGAVEITAVAAGMGPGPFTGLRVGIAAARAFALGRGIPVVPVVSHDAAALAILLADPFADLPPFAVVTDARRREFAYTVYDGLDDDGLPVRRTEPAHILRTDLEERLAELGAERREVSAISAAMIALAGARALAAGRADGPAEPLYLRAPDVTLPAAPKRVGT
ncbi:tRNA (adenosine(37)-N6)-threonylcarbamoyltransferase complex dimerization subunit type 1 TsaB [Microbacterium invictum]|uniref:tRNA threonylcarbamoyl adenosine modification protein YeaZ n=1 Tax=Microbacterium invictum TaxID=515415 RepID=A0AA40SPF6_9MICO|nr:tRNA (adenosine(37)-N6)-threonylcarbamoyltransferase complex dimerization subunit type 1 TsaB [Microbacterium invictum]MBB4140002.1 tRNA threonylcarbamoyl adenosine modification protein YeaZ [Microbacterium invictum]